MKNQLGFVVLMGALAGYTPSCVNSTSAPQTELKLNDVVEQFKKKYSCIGVGVLDPGLARVDYTMARNAAEGDAKVMFVKKCMGKNYAQTGYTVDNPVNIEWSQDGRYAVAYNPASRARK